jgi:molybdopterin/thiamine biosynthesis adenylyltransferase
MKERLPDWDRVDGVIGKEKREALALKRVAIVGQGSLGSEVARLLSMTGVGKLTLIDPDKLDAANITRHAAGLTDLGRYKVAAMRDILKQQKNPEIDIWPVAVDAQLQPELVSKSDLVVISGLGSNYKEAVVAELARKRMVPVLVAGVYVGGVGGEIFLIEGDKRPCFSCFSSFLGKEIKEDNIRHKPIVYGLAEDEVEAVPGLAIDINRIATIAADFCIKTLLGETVHENPDVNLLVYANRRIELGGSLDGNLTTLGQYEAQWFIIPKDENCLICRPESEKEQVSLEKLLESL